MRALSSTIIIFTVINILQLIPTAITTIVYYTSYSGYSGNNITTMHISEGNIVQIFQTNNSNVVMHYTPATINTALSGSIWGTTHNFTARIRSSPLNAHCNTSSLSFLYFSPKVLQVSNNYTNIFIDISATMLLTNIVIVQVCFGSTLNQIYILILETNLTGLLTGKSYAIMFYNSSQYKNKIYLSSVDPNTNALDEFVFNNGRLLLLFTSEIYIYSASNFSLGSQIFSLAYSSTPPTYLDAELSSQILTYSMNNQLFQYDLSLRQYIVQYSFPATVLINSITVILNSCYLVVRTNGTIVQFDACIGLPVFAAGLNFTGTDFQTVRRFGSGFGLYVDMVNFLYTTYHLYNVTAQYPCNQCTCLSTYSYFNQTCIKTTATNTTNYINTTNNTNNTNTINSTSSPTTNQTTPSVQPIDPQPSDPAQSYVSFVDEVLPVQTSKIIGTALIVTSIRVTPKFLLVFTLFLNDLWYYKFHHKQYPQSAKIFMDKIDLVKQFQLNPDALLEYLPFTTSSSNTSQLYERNTRLSQQLELEQDAPDKVYFLYSTEEVYKNSAIMAVFFFAAMKVVHLLLYLARNKAVLLLKLYKFVRAQSRWWSLLTGIIEANGVMLGFCSGLQMELFSSEDTSDKLNLFYMTFMLFCLVFYGSSFYALVNIFDNRRCSQTLLVYTKKSQRSFIFEPLIILARSFIKSFFHSFFLGQYGAQIILLLIADVIFIGFTLSIKRLYRNRVIFFFLTAYFVGFAFFDLYFTLEQYQVITISSNADRQLFGFILCCALALISILLSLSILFESLRDIYKGIKQIIKKNKKSSRQAKQQKINVQPISINKQKQDLKKDLVIPSNFQDKKNRIVPADNIPFTYDNQNTQYFCLAQLKELSNKNNPTLTPISPYSSKIKVKVKKQNTNPFHQEEKSLQVNYSKSKFSTKSQQLNDS